MSLQGSLKELPLPDFVEMTTVGGKTGRLTLYDEHGSAVGCLTFRDGSLVGAACGELGPEKAFFALLGLKNGTFDFDPSAPVAEDGAALPTESLLLEGMRRVDETRRLRRLLPAPATVHLCDGTGGDALERRILGYLGTGEQRVGDIVNGLRAGGDTDEYDALAALDRLAERGVVGIEPPPAEGTSPGGPPQPELER